MSSGRPHGPKYLYGSCQCGIQPNGRSPFLFIKEAGGLSGPLGAKQAEAGWGGQGVGDAAVARGWVGDRWDRQRKLQGWGLLYSGGSQSVSLQLLRSAEQTVGP